MKLIAIQDNVFVNPEHISVVRKTRQGAKSSVSVVVDGRSYTVTKNTTDFLASLSNAGVGMSQQFTSV